MPKRPRRAIIPFRRLVLGLLGLALALVAHREGTAQAPPTETLVFPAVADTYVDASLPTTNFNADGHLKADASPVRISYLRFTVAGLNRRPVVQARVRLQVNSTLADNRRYDPPHHRQRLGRRYPHLRDPSARRRPGSLDARPRRHGRRRRVRPRHGRHHRRYLQLRDRQCLAERRQLQVGRLGGRAEADPPGHGRQRARAERADRAAARRRRLLRRRPDHAPGDGDRYGRGRPLRLAVLALRPPGRPRHRRDGQHDAGAGRSQHHRCGDGPLRAHGRGARPPERHTAATGEHGATGAITAPLAGRTYTAGLPIQSPPARTTWRKGTSRPASRGHPTVTARSARVRASPGRSAPACTGSAPA